MFLGLIQGFSSTYLAHFRRNWQERAGSLRRICDSNRNIYTAHFSTFYWKSVWRWPISSIHRDCIK